MYATIGCGASSLSVLRTSQSVHYQRFNCIYTVPATHSRPTAGRWARPLSPCLASACVETGTGDQTTATPSEQESSRKKLQKNCKK